ncbi:MAG TPA: HD domain-containing protein, partial [bacterium]|nr:HD domain-containing protein [bacterium]
MSKKDKKQIAKIIELLENIGILKRIPRMGWKLRGIPECETVASHSFRVVFITLVIAEILKDKYSINFEKLLKIATLHEIPEAFITDLALKPAKYIGFDIKQKAEIAAFKDIFSGFDFEKQYLEYWLEFENNTTIEG